MLCLIGFKVKHDFLICGENMEIIQNCNFTDILLKSKHVGVYFHKTREAYAVGVHHPVKIRYENNFSDILTKAVTKKNFWGLYDTI